ncbi:MAG: hypothetical protein ACYDHY_18895 [Acidiferrobacterales bacterium]
MAKAKREWTAPQVKLKSKRGWLLGGSANPMRHHCLHACVLPALAQRTHGIIALNHEGKFGMMSRASRGEVLCFYLKFFPHFLHSDCQNP